VRAAQPTLALIRVIQATAITAAPMWLYLRASTEAGKPAQLVPINPPTQITRATAAQATAVLM
jgi:hypothetical protein